MRFLLLLISFIFSFIFYLFHIKIVWDSIFFWKINNPIQFDTIFLKPGIISIIFIIIWIIFLLFFSDFKKNNNKEKISFKELLNILYNNILSFIFLLISPLWLYYYFNTLQLGHKYLSIIYFILSILFYFILINIKYFKNKKDYRIIVKYLSLIFIYLSTVFWILYILKQWNNSIIYIIITYSLCFNFYIHLKFKNFISLLFSIISLGLLLYQLFPLLEF